MVTLEQIVQDLGPIAGIVVMIIGFIGLLWAALAGCSKCG